jgi:hypothetical protein
MFALVTVKVDSDVYLSFLFSDGEGCIMRSFLVRLTKYY